MSCALIVIGDGRDEYHEQAWQSAQQHLPLRLIDQKIVIDDRAHELGFAGAIQAAWDQVQTDWVFHLEADFTFNARIPLADMIDVLADDLSLAQIVLKRQPWNEEERAAGGIVEQHPDDFTEEHRARGTIATHRRFWSTNPSVYSSRWCRLGWPQEPRSEGVFTHRLLRDPLLRFAFWGAPLDPPLVHHIGDERAGTGY